VEGKGREFLCYLDMLYLINSKLMQVSEVAFLFYQYIMKTDLVIILYLDCKSSDYMNFSLVSNLLGSLIDSSAKYSQLLLNYPLNASKY
jgi:hypothetical protein